MEDTAKYVDRNTLQWVGSAIVLIVVAMILGAFTFWKDSVLEDQAHDEKIEYIIIKGAEQIESIESLHNKDITYLKEEIEEVKANQVIIMNDIKQLLREK